MNIKPIDELAEFQAAADPLRSLQKELGENRRRQQEISRELRELSTNNNQGDAFETYLESAGPHLTARLDELAKEVGNLESREKFLSNAEEQGREKVERLRSQLAAPICQEARRAFMPHIKAIFDSIQAIYKANGEIRRIRNDIELKGYRTGRLPVGIFDVDGGGVAGYRAYVRQNFPELANGNKGTE